MKMQMRKDDEETGNARNRELLSFTALVERVDGALSSCVAWSPLLPMHYCTDCIPSLAIPDRGGKYALVHYTETIAPGGRSLVQRPTASGLFRRHREGREDYRYRTGTQKKRRAAVELRQLPCNKARVVARPARVAWSRVDPGDLQRGQTARRLLETELRWPLRAVLSSHDEHSQPNLCGLAWRTEG